MSAPENPPAFPHPSGWRRDPDVSDGMSLRDYVAIHALPAIIAATSAGQHMPTFPPGDMGALPAAICRDALVMADAFLIERAKKNQEPS